MKKCPKCGKEYQDTNTLCPSDGAVLEKAGDGLVGQTLASKYRIEELINEGGMGAVYRAIHILMDKTVAIKVLHPSLAADDKIVARFSREARAASRISHPHALNVTDFGESENGVVFLVMEYLRGRTLKEVIREDGPMPLPRAVEIIRQVSGALDAAHAEGVVHRDLKSDNIMLMDVGDDDWAKVLDFGIAKIQEPIGTTDPALTAPNLIIGTPQYMSPEQCSQASEIDSRSDIYSLGIILYEMLAGHVPFTAESPTAIMMKHLQDAPPSILEERQDLPASVGRVVARALAKRPEDRFQSAGELSEGLGLAAGTNAPALAATVTATDPSSSERSTNRIIVPTGPNEAPRDTANADYDEETVVRKREEKPVEAAPVVRSEIFAAETAPPPPESFNPWRIIIPAAAAILVAFVVIYALTRNSGQAGANTNQQTAPLASDPNSQPVQPAQPATGQGEQGISSSLPVPSPSLGANANTNAKSSTENLSGANLNQDAEASPASDNTNAGRNSNAKRNSNSAEQNDNADSQDETKPSPSPAKSDESRPANNNKARPTPSSDSSKPDNTNNDKEPPPPLPKPKPSLPQPIKPSTDNGPALPTKESPDR